MRRACAGETAAWDSLYARFTPKFQVQAVRFLSKPADRAAVEDLVQEVWTHILSHRENLRERFDPERGTLDALLAVTARNFMVSVMRSKSRNPSSQDARLDNQPDPVETRLDPAAAAEKHEQLERMYSCLGQEVKPEDVELLSRILVNGEDIEEIAAERKTKSNTLYQRISRARQRLRECMDRVGPLR